MAEVDTSAEAVARMLDGVTPGPWVEFISDDGGQWTGWPLSIDCTSIVDKTIVRPGGQWPYKWDAKTSCDEACANARFIAWAREAVPALAAERDRLAGENARLREYYHASEAITAIEHEWRRRKAGGDGILDLRDKLTHAETRLYHARAALGEP